jgi:hypothetical protein
VGEVPYFDAGASMGRREALGLKMPEMLRRYFGGVKTRGEVGKEEGEKEEVAKAAVM